MLEPYDIAESQHITSQMKIRGLRMDTKSTTRPYNMHAAPYHAALHAHADTQNLAFA